MSSELKSYEKAGRVFKLLGWIALVASIGLGVAIIVPAIANGKFVLPMIFVPVLPLCIACLYIALGNAIKDHREGAKIIGIILGFLMLIGFPIGTLIGGYILYCLIKGWNE